MKANEKYYTAQQVAEAIGLSPAAVRAMAREGKVRFVRRGISSIGKMLFPESEFRRLKSAYRATPVPTAP